MRHTMIPIILAGVSAVFPLCATAQERPEGRARYESEREARDVDNTGINQRDQDERTLTPLDQSSGDAQTKLTAEIRSAIVSEEGLSTSAKNIKIITTDDGTVTLRGPVETAREKARIVALARQKAKSANVRDQLEVTAEDEAAENDPDAFDDEVEEEVAE